MASRQHRLVLHLEGHLYLDQSLVSCHQRLDLGLRVLDLRNERLHVGARGRLGVAIQERVDETVVRSLKSFGLPSCR